MNYWPVVESYFKNTDLIKQNIESYNLFVEKELSEIIKENKIIESKVGNVELELSNLQILPPQVIEADGSRRNDAYPMEIRLRDKSYTSPIYVDISLKRKGVVYDQKRSYIGDLPIMVKSSKCLLNGLSKEELIALGEDPKDPGGYFVINGSEKIIVNQEILADKRMLVSDLQNGKVAVDVISTKGAFRGKVRIIRNPNGLLEVSFPSSPKKLKLFTLLRALGLETFEDYKNAFSNKTEVRNDVLLNFEKIGVESEEEALDKIGKYVAPGQILSYRLRRAQEVIDSFLLPHIGQTPQKRLMKAYYLTTMAERSIEKAYGKRTEDDKDNYMNKKIDMSGKLLAQQFRYAFKFFVSDIKFQIDRNIVRRRKLNINTVIRPSALTDRLNFAMATGSWAARLQGVSKYVEKVNWLSNYIELRRVRSTLDRTRENYEARDVHGSALGRICPIQTPDGPMCGLAKNLALMARVTNEIDSDSVQDVVTKLGIVERYKK
jgi:DNA-directed RNA polymerase subunit B